jgi:hypothetical protein
MKALLIVSPVLLLFCGCVPQPGSRCPCVRHLSNAPLAECGRMRGSAASIRGRPPDACSKIDARGEDKAMKRTRSTKVGGTVSRSSFDHTKEEALRQADRAELAAAQPAHAYFLMPSQRRRNEKDTMRHPAHFLPDERGPRCVCRAKPQYTRQPSRDSGAEMQRLHRREPGRRRSVLRDLYAERRGPGGVSEGLWTLRPDRNAPLPRCRPPPLRRGQSA